MDTEKGISRRTMLAATGVAAVGAGGMLLLGADAAEAGLLGPTRSGRAYVAELNRLENELERVHARLGRLAEVASDAPEPVRPEAVRALAAIADQAGQIGDLAVATSRVLSPAADS